MHFGAAKKLKSEVEVEQRNESSSILKAFAADTSEAGKAVAELLQNPTKEAADELLKKLPDLMPEDSAMEAVLAEAMANEFAKEDK